MPCPCSHLYSTRFSSGGGGQVPCRLSHSVNSSVHEPSLVQTMGTWKAEGQWLFGGTQAPSPAVLRRCEAPPVPVTHPHARRLAVQHALAVQLEALGAVVHAFKDRRGWLAHHGDAVPLFPLPAFQALDLQELPGETQVESWAAASQNASLISWLCIPQRQEQPGCPSLVLKPPSVGLCHATPQHNPCSARTFPSPCTGLGVPGTSSHPPHHLLQRL